MEHGPWATAMQNDNKNAANQFGLRELLVFIAVVGAVFSQLPTDFELVRETIENVEGRVDLWIQRDPDAFRFRMAYVIGAVFTPLLASAVALELVNRRLQHRNACSAPPPAGLVPVQR